MIKYKIVLSSLLIAIAFNIDAQTFSQNRLVVSSSQVQSGFLVPFAKGMDMDRPIRRSFLSTASFLDNMVIGGFTEEKNDPAIISDDEFFFSWPDLNLEDPQFISEFQNEDGTAFEIEFGYNAAGANTFGSEMGGSPFFVLVIPIAATTPTVPTLGEWGLITLSLLLLIFGIIAMRQQAFSFSRK